MNAHLLCRRRTGMLCLHIIIIMLAALLHPCSTLAHDSSRLAVVHRLFVLFQKPVTTGVASGPFCWPCSPSPAM